MRSILLGLVCCAIGGAQDTAALRRGFERPPGDARIMMRWWWFGPAVTNAELEHEMRLMKEGGIGGFEVQPVYPLELDDPERGFRNLPYLSEEFRAALRFTSQTAQTLGLRFDLTLGSGWPFGGPHIPVTQAAGRLRVDRMSVAAGTRSVPLPAMSNGEKLVAAFLDGKRIEDIARGAVHLPAGGHSLQFFISGRTGMQVKRASTGAEGFVLDHYNRAALDNHLQHAGEPLLNGLPHPPYAVFSDSLEVFGSDWTDDFPEQFRKRRGYDLMPYLPALVGDIGENTGAVRNDWGRTLAELCEERYLTPMREWARAHHTRFRSQTYGTPPVTLSSQSLVDLPEGEGTHWRGFSTSRWASSANHIYGRPVTSSETWTWLHSPSFRATPLDMKAEADLHFLEGINQLIGHGWPYSPPIAGRPGWRFYAAAVFNDHNPWWIVMPDIARYLQRMSYLLRQGKPANDVAIFLPTADARARFRGGRVSVNREMDGLLGDVLIPQVLDAGYNFDFIDDDAVERGALPYRVIVLPGVERIRLSTYRKIVSGKARVIATRRLPSLAPGLMEAGDSAAIRQLSAKLRVTEETALGKELARVLAPDCAISDPAVGCIHRKLDSADVYFMANTGNQPVRAQARVRSGLPRAEWWDPFTGRATAAGKAPFTLNLERYESRVLVMVKGEPGAAPARGKVSAALDLSRDWTVVFPEQRLKMDTLRSWADDPATKYFSGQAVYEKTVTVDASLLQPGARLFITFGQGTPAAGKLRNGMRAALESPVREAAVVAVNGRSAGTVWRPPYEIEVTGLLRAGGNTLRVTVGNLAINALAGRPQPTYRLLNLRYGERFTPQDMDGLTPLPAGLLGPVKLEVRR